MEGKFDTWAVIELFGHQRIAGRVTEQSIGGNSFVRVDVPEENGQQAFSKLYGQGAIYCITPCSEELARAALRRIQPEPVNIYIPELRQLPVQKEPLPFDYTSDEQRELMEPEDDEDDSPFC